MVRRRVSRCVCSILSTGCELTGWGYFRERNQVLVRDADPTIDRQLLRDARCYSQSRSFDTTSANAFLWVAADGSWNGNIFEPSCLAQAERDIQGLNQVRGVAASCWYGHVKGWRKLECTIGSVSAAAVIPWNLLNDRNVKADRRRLERCLRVGLISICSITEEERGTGGRVNRARMPYQLDCGRFL